MEIINYIKQHASAGEQIFFDIYSEAEKQADPAKRNMGLFYFRGGEGKRFAVCNAGDGFSYVGAMHDSYPHALELSKRGYHAFALIYRPGAQIACEDMARTVDLICSMADEMGIDTSVTPFWAVPPAHAWRHGWAATECHISEA